MDSGSWRGVGVADGAGAAEHDLAVARHGTETRAIDVPQDVVVLEPGRIRFDYFCVRARPVVSISNLTVTVPRDALALSVTLVKFSGPRSTYVVPVNHSRRNSSPFGTVPRAPTPAGIPRPRSGASGSPKAVFQSPISRRHFGYGERVGARLSPHETQRCVERVPCLPQFESLGCGSCSRSP